MQTNTRDENQLGKLEQALRDDEAAMAQLTRKDTHEGFQDVVRYNRMLDHAERLEEEILRERERRADGRLP